MNNTNRVLNRVLLLIVGLALLGLGALGVTVLTWPTATETWTAASEGADSWLHQAIDATRIAGTGASWVVIAAVAAVILVIVLLILALVNVTGRRTRTVIRSTGAQNPLGRVTVTEAFVSDAVKNSLAERDEILSTSVTANDVRKSPVLHVAVTPRQNTDPRDVVERIDRLLTNLRALTGQDAETYISVHSGLRARLAHDQQRLS